MSVIEITATILGHYEVSREYSFRRGETINHYEWIDGCGPSGEVGIKISGVYNVSSKEIKEVEFKWVPVDASGDVVGKEIKCKTKEIGLFDNSKPYLENVWERLWVAPTAQNVKIITVRVTYYDGTEEIIAGEDVKYTYDEDSEWKKRLNAEKKAKEAEKKAKEQAEKDKKLKEVNSRNDRGIVAYAGRVDGKDNNDEDCKIEKIGEVTYYLQKRSDGRFFPIGWESTNEIVHLDLSYYEGIHSACLKNPKIECVTFPRYMKSISYWRRDRTDLNFGIISVKKIIIPKEICEFWADSENMGSIREVEFEDPCGWGVSKKIITDPKKMYEYIFKNRRVQLHKSFINKIKYKLGL